MNKKIIFLFFVLILLVISGCKSKKNVQKALDEIRTGTEAIVMSFLPNAPPALIHTDDTGDTLSNIFEVVLEVRNKGAYPQPENRDTWPEGRIFLSGYDTNIIRFDKDPAVEELRGKALEGKSPINPNGGLDLISFKGTIFTENLNVEKYEPTLLATACYEYLTIAGPSVCIDPNPYSIIKERKVCQVDDLTLSSQGAPIAVTSIDEEALAAKTQFRITIKNVGGGDVIQLQSLNKCSPTGERIAREDMDKVYLEEAKIGNRPLLCGPFTNRDSGVVKSEVGEIRLVNGEGFIICELSSSEYADTKSTYTSPMKITLHYGYRNTIEKKIQIKKEITSTSSGTFIPPSVPATSQVQEPE